MPRVIRVVIENTGWNEIGKNGFAESAIREWRAQRKEQYHKQIDRKREISIDEIILGCIRIVETVKHCYELEDRRNGERKRTWS